VITGSEPFFPGIAKVPAGTYMMGSPHLDAATEEPAHAKSKPTGNLASSYRIYRRDARPAALRFEATTLRFTALL
jgi:hypothetical protein